MLRDNDNGGAALGQLGVLEGPALRTPGHHEPGVGVVGHAVGCGGGIEGGAKVCLSHPDIQLHRFAAIEKPIEVLMEKGPDAAVEPQPFPHAVTEQKARVVDRHLGLGPGHQFAVDPNLDGLVPGV